MKKLIFKCAMALKFGWMAFWHPEVFDKNLFEMSRNILDLIFRVAAEKHPRMMRIAIVHPTVDDQDVVTVWAGAGMASSPVNRNEELIRENEALRKEIKKLMEAKK